ncbi:MAG: poly-gamma-glutamate system protein [Synergistaceae bacterium]|nr:poly-gamma-glutamate system protein [Synergistaceae bacterium]
MDAQEFIRYQQEMRRIYRRVSATLLMVLLVMILLWVLSGSSLSPREKKIYSSIAEAQSEIWRWKETLGKNQKDIFDRNRTGLIGLEWSSISTTIGDLPSKRTSCDPRWGIVISRWLDELDVHSKDSVVVLSSSSFPGMTLNVLMALEERDADVCLVLSLGSSTWGANDPDMTWPVVSAHLRELGLLRTGQRYLTLGGGGDNGGGLSEDGIEKMNELAASESTQLIVRNSLAEMIAWKMQVIKEIKPKAVINIGGAHSSLGADDSAIGLAPGLHRIQDKSAGDGVIAKSLEAGYPVIHLLNMRELCTETGVPFDSAPRPFMRGSKSIVCAFVGLLVFAAVLFFSKRWKIMP